EGRRLLAGLEGPLARGFRGRGRKHLGRSLREDRPRPLLLVLEVAEDVRATAERVGDPSTPRPEIVLAVLLLAQAEVCERIGRDRRLAGGRLTGAGDAPRGALRRQDLPCLRPGCMAALVVIAERGRQVR